MLYSALADEWLAYFQYWAAYNCTCGKGKTDVDPEFEQHAYEEFDHANKIIQRIKELGGRSICKIEGLNELCSVPSEGACTDSPVELLTITIEAEENAIKFYKELEAVSRGADPTTNRLAKQIL